MGTCSECLRTAKRLVQLEQNEQGEGIGTEAGGGGTGGPVLIVGQNEQCAFYSSWSGEPLKALEREGSSPFCTLKRFLRLLLGEWL